MIGRNRSRRREIRLSRSAPIRVVKEEASVKAMPSTCSGTNNRDILVPVVRYLSASSNVGVEEESSAHSSYDRPEALIRYRGVGNRTAGWNFLTMVSLCRGDEQKSGEEGSSSSLAKSGNEKERRQGGGGWVTYPRYDLLREDEFFLEAERELLLQNGEISEAKTQSIILIAAIELVERAFIVNDISVLMETPPLLPPVFVEKILTTARDDDQDADELLGLSAGNFPSLPEAYPLCLGIRTANRVYSHWRSRFVDWGRPLCRVYWPYWEACIVPLLVQSQLKRQQKLLAVISYVRWSVCVGADTCVGGKVNSEGGGAITPNGCGGAHPMNLRMSLRMRTGICYNNSNTSVADQDEEQHDHHNGGSSAKNGGSGASSRKRLQRGDQLGSSPFQHLISSASTTPTATPTSAVSDGRRLLTQPTTSLMLKKRRSGIKKIAPEILSDEGGCSSLQRIHKERGTCQVCASLVLSSPATPSRTWTTTTTMLTTCAGCGIKVHEACYYYGDEEDDRTTTIQDDEERCYTCYDDHGVVLLKHQGNDEAKKEDNTIASTPTTRIISPDEKKIKMSPRRGSWRCDVCRHQDDRKNDDTSINSSATTQLCKQSKDMCSVATCCLCLRSGGALKLSPIRWRWIHLSCLLWLCSHTSIFNTTELVAIGADGNLFWRGNPSFALDRFLEQQPIAKEEDDTSSSASKIALPNCCVVCASLDGHTIGCNMVHCESRFHAPCFMEGLMLKKNFVDGSVDFEAFCPEHLTMKDGKTFTLPPPPPHMMVENLKKTTTSDDEAEAEAEGDAISNSTTIAVNTRRMRPPGCAETNCRGGRSSSRTKRKQKMDNSSRWQQDPYIDDAAIQPGEHKFVEVERVIGHNYAPVKGMENGRKYFWFKCKWKGRPVKEASSVTFESMLPKPECNSSGSLRLVVDYVSAPRKKRIGHEARVQILRLLNAHRSLFDLENQKKITALLDEVILQENASKNNEGKTNNNIINKNARRKLFIGGDNRGGTTHNNMQLPSSSSLSAAEVQQKPEQEELALILVHNKHRPN